MLERERANGDKCGGESMMHGCVAMTGFIHKIIASGYWTIMFARDKSKKS